MKLLSLKLLSLKLFNFRQFWGEVTLELAHQSSRSVTVIHGNNGAGKTTLLNGFTWVLYDQRSPAFAPGPLVNNRALGEVPVGSLVECWAEVLFEGISARRNKGILVQCIKKHPMEKR
jgi:DNA sulfur modification protein DndD